MTTSSGIRILRLSYAVFGLALLLPFQLYSQTSASLVVTGHVPEAFQLQLAEPVSADPRIAVQIVPVGPNAVLIKMTVAKSMRQGKLKLPLAMRTNSAQYALRAKSVDNSVNAFVSVSHPRGMGDGASLFPGAAESFNSQITPIAAGALVASGRRISRRGNGLTPNNALIADLEVSFDGIAANMNENQLSFIVCMERL